jgi:uncharacterized membrane protein
LEWLGRVVFTLIILIGLLITIKSLDYYVPDFTRGFLSDKETIFKGTYKVAFFAHIIVMPIILLIGSIQIFFNRDKSGGKAHRFFGKVYVFLILFIAAPSGIVMSFYAFGGLASILNFITLSTLLFVFTYQSFISIISGNIIKHKKNIVRAYLLVLSAILLRVFSFICIHYFNWDGENMYTTIAWCSWLPALLIYELSHLKITNNKA